MINEMDGLNQIFSRGVNFDYLEFADDSDMVLYNDNPFSGLAYELYPNGQIMHVTSYKNGFEDGVCREWYASGEIKCEFEMNRGRIHGDRKYWHRNGSIKSIAHYELAFELDYTEWDEHGNLLLTREVNPNDPNSRYDILLEARKWEEYT
ncbi:toxin-antitoxin system YwqK family antitoxin [Paenibacillus sanguinis]|uniref:toxin-antitoxin system YwqK family antitoxin n=1 Tax=Paenibacillus sanguinis TaxID=225906 RepID=UPI0003651C99|nr:hypothetical protein [Paenibacillus sanguinis]